VDLNDPTFVQGLVSGKRQNMDEFQEEFYGRFYALSLKLLGGLGTKKNIKDEAHIIAVEVLFELEKYLDFAGKSGDHIENYCWITFWRFFNKYKKGLQAESNIESAFSSLDEQRGQLVGPNIQVSIGQRLDFTHAVSKLKEDERQVFKLRFQEGYSEAETANIIGIPLKTVKATVKRIKRKMEATLKEKPKAP
jgi:RNA polymerase sigma factor (sigma-70 family)